MSHIELCLASRSFYPVFSGVGLRFLRYLPGLKERGIHTRVLTGTPISHKAKSSGIDSAWQGYRPGDLLPPRMVDDVPVYTVRLPDTGVSRRVFIYGRTLARFCKLPDYHPDLVQILSLPLWATPWLLELRRLNIPTVFTYSLTQKLSSNPVKRNIQRLYQRLPLQTVDHVVVSSMVVRDRVERLGVSTPVTIIPNGVDLTRFRPAATQAERQKMRRTLGIDETAPIIVTVGGVNPRKGTDLLLSAWCQLAPKCPDSHLVIVGPRHDLADSDLEWFRRKLQDLVSISGAPDRIHFVGLAENVEEYLQAADLFVFTSLREGMGNVVLEAMATGLPVITTPFLGLPDEFGRPGEQFFLIDRDPGSLADLVELLLQDKSLRAMPGQSGLRWVKSQMSLETSLDQYADLYRALAGRYGAQKTRKDNGISDPNHNASGREENSPIW